MRPVFNDVAVICPEAVTGGPEALHQLSHVIGELGGRSGLAYFGGNSKLELVEGGGVCRIVCSADPQSPTRHAYERYRPRLISEMALDADNLAIFPEFIAETARNARFGRRAIWWLSVDNGIRFNPQLGYQSYRDEFFAEADLIHFYQSDYARDFLARNGAREIYPLFDYTDETFLEGSGNPSEKKAQIAYFPQKGAALAAEFIAAAPDLSFAPIENMTKAQVRKTLEDSLVYIDFGHHPGKDRVPREAASVGATVLLHEMGAGANFVDHPLSRDYLFSVGDIRSGRLTSRIRDILADPSAHAAGQRYYRQRIRLEKEEFRRQVQGFFFG